ncbi:MAG: hypothetical protein WBW62_02970, partial [Solirubrobacterales bacterium]
KKDSRARSRSSVGKGAVGQESRINGPAGPETMVSRQKCFWEQGRFAIFVFEHVFASLQWLK